VTDDAGEVGAAVLLEEEDPEVDCALLLGALPLGSLREGGRDKRRGGEGERRKDAGTMQE
jgi:hypothetical protein